MISTLQLSNPTSSLDDQIADAARRAGRAISSPRPLQASAVPRRPFASMRGLVLTWILCLGLTLLNVELGGVFTAPIDAPEPLRLVAGLETSAALKGRLVEAYLARHGTLPSSLAEVGLEATDPDLRYERLDPLGYRVIVRHGHHEGVFDSRREAERRAALAAARAEAARELDARRATWVAETELWILEAESRASRRTESAEDLYLDVETDRAYLEESSP